MIFDKLIVIQKINESSEEWDSVFTLHANVNKAKSNSEYLNAGAVQGKETLTFEVRYFKDIEEIRLDTQSYRILFNDIPYNITDYDDFMFKHKTVKLLGVSY